MEEINSFEQSRPASLTEAIFAELNEDIPETKPDLELTEKQQTGRLDPTYIPHDNNL